MAIRGPYDSYPSSGISGSFGERVRVERIRRGLTQQDLAEALRTDQTTISVWERGKVKPSGAALSALAMFFGVSTEYLEQGTASGSGSEPSEAGSPRTITLPPPSRKGIATVDLQQQSQQVTEPFEAMNVLMQAINQGRSVWIVVD